MPYPCFAWTHQFKSPHCVSFDTCCVGQLFFREGSIETVCTALEAGGDLKHTRHFGSSSDAFPVLARGATREAARELFIFKRAPPSMRPDKTRFIDRESKVSAWALDAPARRRRAGGKSKRSPTSSSPVSTWSSSPGASSSSSSPSPTATSASASSTCESSDSLSSATSRTGSSSFN